MKERLLSIPQHNADHCAQEICTDFLQVVTSSTEALMNSGTLLSHLTTTKIKDGNWKGSSKTFVLNWINKLHMFHELTPVADRMSENMQRILLQNTVLGLDALQQVQIVSDLQNTTHVIALIFAQYRSVLRSTRPLVTTNKVISPVLTGNSTLGIQLRNSL